MSRRSLTETIRSAVAALRGALSELEADSGLSGNWLIALGALWLKIQGLSQVGRLLRVPFHCKVLPSFLSRPGSLWCRASLGTAIPCLTRRFSWCLPFTERTVWPEPLVLGRPACRLVPSCGVKGIILTLLLSLLFGTGSTSACCAGATVRCATSPLLAVSSCTWVPSNAPTLCATGSPPKGSVGSTFGLRVVVPPTAQNGTDHRVPSCAGRRWLPGVGSTCFVFSPYGVCASPAPNRRHTGRCAHRCPGRCNGGCGPDRGPRSDCGALLPGKCGSCRGGRRRGFAAYWEG